MIARLKHVDGSRTILLDEKEYRELVECWNTKHYLFPDILFERWCIETRDFERV